MSERRVVGALWGMGALWGIASLLGVPLAEAKVYPSPVLVESEDDLRALSTDGLLDEDDLDTLIDLWHNPLDLNEASRNRLFDLPGVSLGLADAMLRERKKGGAFEVVEDLLRVEGMNEELLEQVAPFVEVRPKLKVGWEGVRGTVRARVAVTAEPRPERPEDDHSERTHRVEELGFGQAPAGFVAARMRYGSWLNVGVLGLAQPGLSEVVYTRETREFHGTWGRPVWELGKGYVHSQRGRVSFLLGSYTAGFGRGLVFDRTSRTRPDGWYADLTVQGVDRFSLRRGLTGAVATVSDVRLGDWSMDATGFVSSGREDVYQYDVGVSGGDPTAQDSEDAPSPSIYVQDAEGVYQRTGWLRLPNAYREDLAGASVTMHRDARTRVGGVAYVGRVDRTTITGIEDPNELVLRGGYPPGDVYGAFGVHGAAGFGQVDVFAEVARTGTGGTAGMMEAVWSPSWGTIEASVRHYDTDFDNPHARGLAAPDQVEGMRDRDEQGARLDAQVRALSWVTARVRADVWRNISLDRTNLEVFGRVDATPLRDVVLTGVLSHRDRDLARGGRTREYGGDYGDGDFGDTVGDGVDDLPEDETGDRIEGAGVFRFVGGQVRVDGVPRTRLAAFYRRSYLDAGLLYPDDGSPCVPWYQIGQYGWVWAEVRPIDALAVSARLRYRDDDIYGDADDRWVDAFGQVGWALPKRGGGAARARLTVRGVMERALPDAPADWEAACAGDIALEGTCVVDPSAGVAGDEERAPWTGVVWARVEVRL